MSHHDGRCRRAESRFRLRFRAAGSGEEGKDGRNLEKLAFFLRRTPPGFDRLRADRFVLPRHVLRDAKPRVGAKNFEEALQHRTVAVGRFDEENRFAPGGFALEREKRFSALRVGDGEVAREAEVLSVKPARHERQKKRRRSHERHHAAAFGLHARDDLGARVGDAGTARFAHDRHVVPLAKGLEPRVDLRGIGLVPDLDDRKRGDRLRVTEVLEVMARRLGGFDEKMVDLTGLLANVKGNHRSEGFLADHGGKKIERSRHGRSLSEVRGEPEGRRGRASS